MREEGEIGNAAGESPSTIGPLLQAAREANGFTIEAAAAASKVPLSFVRLMEQEQFHLVPDPLYLIRFLTEYAAFLGLDPRQFEAQLRGGLGSAKTDRPLYMGFTIGPRSSLRRLTMYLLPAAAIIPLIFIGLSLFSGQQPVSPPVRQSELPASDGAAAPFPAAVTAAPPSPQTPPLDAAHGPRSSPPRYKLLAEATETTWLGVSADGAARRGVLLRSGETAQWSAKNGFVVTIGNAGGVALTLNGRPIVLNGKSSGGVIRDLVLPENGELPLAGR